VKHFLLFYHLVDDYLARRPEFRGAHLVLAKEAVTRGEMVRAGALNDPADMAVLLFQGDSPDVAERFAQADPYVRTGLVRRWEVREWTTVIGAGAAHPA